MITIPLSGKSQEKLNTRNKFLLLGIIAIILIAVIADVNADSRREKARYYYLLGTEQEAAGNDAEAYEFFRRAAETDSGYHEGVYAFNTLRLRLTTDSLSPEDIKASLPQVRKFIDEYPGDLFESRYYAYLASHLGIPEEAVRVYRKVDSLNPGKSDVLLDLADAYMTLDSLRPALATLSRVEEMEGKSTELSVRKITFLMADKDSIGALAEATNLVESNPRSPSFRLLRGNVFEILNLPDSALAEYGKALKLDPEGSGPKLALAQTYANKGDSTAFDEMMYQVLLCEDLELAHKLEITTRYLSRLIADNSSTERGDHLFSVLREQYPHEPEVLDLSARYNAAKENWRAAQEEISYAIDLKPENADYWSQLMSYYIADDKPDKAEETYFRAEKFMPTTEAMKFLLSGAYTISKQNDKAIDLLSGIIRDYSKELPLLDSITDKRPIRNFDIRQLYQLSNAYTSLGDAYVQKTDTVSAMKAYINAITIFPDNSMAMNNYAYFLCLQGDIAKAEKLASAALYLNPDNPSILDTYAWILFKLKKYDEAEKYQMAAIEHTPEGEETEELFHHFGDILFMAGKPEEALKYWEKALELDPDNALLKKKVTNKTYFYE